MRIHEYEAKNLFREFKIPIPRGDVAASPGEARKVAEEIGLPVTMKAQVLVGGRGKAGGIKFAEDLGEVRELSCELLGMDIKGYKVESILVEEKLEIERELYLYSEFNGIFPNRLRGLPYPFS
ncbi:unnamed protein product [marine sediment metagenome]|uniref:ATP-grasp domain-containing protein n=1 Tax=marine sediment metagenome TaxID=412755 RepID=X1HAH9_9ZZZZ